MKCPNCGFDTGDYKFCGKCGTALFTKCKSCHKEFSLENRFCPFCGKDNLEQEKEEITIKEEERKEMKEQPTETTKKTVGFSSLFIIFAFLGVGLIYFSINTIERERDKQYRIKVEQQREERAAEEKAAKKIDELENVNHFIELGSFGITVSNSSSFYPEKYYFLFKPFKTQEGELAYNLSGGATTDAIYAPKDFYHNREKYHNISADEYTADKIISILEMLNLPLFYPIIDISDGENFDNDFPAEIKASGIGLGFAAIDVRGKKPMFLEPWQWNRYSDNGKKTKIIIDWNKNISVEKE